ncbi:tape measure protein [uncultured Corynebacterium sp.]|uniref:tape measure protein n=1 Tax=uncultured Corynebacterium sp. TaxID=159447 RepID=UPI00263344B2|nr:tape measure protein [uncultured Corynebacterium sp.]
MALNLGELYAKITVKDDGVNATLNRVKDGLDDVKTSADKVEKITIKTNADTKDAERAKRATEDLGKASERTSRQAKQIKFPKDFAPDAERAKKSVENVGDSIAGAAAKFTKFTAAAAGTAVIGTIGGSLYKGFQRLDSIDQASAKLEALGNSGADVRDIMDNALASVKGTAFGLGEAATVSAQMVASGVKPGQELESVLGTVADTAAIAGSSMEDMGLIFGSVAARGKLQGDDMMQMLGRGIPVLQILAEQLGVTSAEVSEMVSEGEIDFQTFADAMEGYVGGGAKRMGDTVSGALKNLGAAFGRMGAEATKGVFAEAPAVIGELTGQVDQLGSVVGPMAQEWSARLTPVLSDAATSVIPMTTAALGMLSDGLELSLPLLQGLTKAISAVPTPILAAGLITLTAKHQGWTKSLETGSDALRNWTRFARSADGAGGKMAAAFRSASTPMMVLGRETRTSAQELTGMARVAGTAQGSVQQLGGVAAGVASGAMSGFKTGVSGIISMLGGPWGVAIMGATALLGHLASEHMKAKQAEQEHEQAQVALKQSLDETTGAITAQTSELQAKTAQENGWLDTAREIGLAQSDITDAMNGNSDAISKVEAATNVATRSAIESSNAWQKHGQAFTDAGISVDLLAQAINGNVDAAREVSQAMDAVPSERLRSKYTNLQAEVDDTTDKFHELRTGITGAAEDMEKVQAEHFTDRMNAAAGVIDDTRQAFALLGESITSVPDDKTIVVDSMAPEVREQVRELKGEIQDLPDGTVQVTFPEGVNIMAMLDEIGATAKAGVDGRVDLSDNTDEVKQRLLDLGLAAEVDGKLMLTDNLSEVMAQHMELEAVVEDDLTGELVVNDNIAMVKQWLTDLGQEVTNIPAGEVRIADDTPEVRAHLHNLGIEVADLPDGHVAITDTTPENLAKLAELGITTENLPPGHVAITDTSDENIKRLNDLGIKTTTLPDGRVIIADNAAETAANIKSVLAPEKINTFSDHVVNITRRITDIFTRSDANGGIYDGAQRAVAFADGGTTRALNQAMAGPRKEPAHVATITPPGTYRVHGESETGGEAYIPLASSKRDRSTRILNEVATAFGYNLVTNEGHAVALADGAILPGVAVTQKLKYMDGTPYVFGGWSPAGVDCSGAVSLGVNTALGAEDPFKAGRTATAGMAAWLTERNFRRGRGTIGDIRIGFLNGGPGGGHAAMQMDDGTYIESGGNTGGGFTIGGKAGPLEGRGFTDFYYLPGATPLDGETGLDYFNKLGGRSRSGTSREINGGAGPLIRDGSVLELAAALYSLHTGTPMDDDVVSWGQAVGLYSEAVEKDGKKTGKQLAKSIADKTEKLEKLRKDLPDAEEDLRIATMKRDELDSKKKPAPSQVAAADQRVSKAERKVEEMQQEIADLERELGRQRDDTDTSDGLKITAMADGGILGNARSASINEGSAVLWAEDGPEAYIPLSSNKRAQSLEIWAETGKRLGVDVMSMLNMVGAALPGLMQGQLNLSTGASTSMHALGVNEDAASYRAKRGAHDAVQNAVGAVFNGPVQINDPKNYLQGQLDSAGKQLGNAMRSVMLK